MSRLRWTLVAAATLVAGALSWSGLSWRQDRQIQDMAVRNWPVPPDPRLAIIAIDDRSLQALGSWPWPRAVHARLVDQLSAAGANAVALDLVFSEPDSRAPDDDRTLGAAIARNGRICLPVIPSMDAALPPQELLPTPTVAAGTHCFGHTDLERDADGVTRGVYLRAGLGDAHWPALGAALAGVEPPPPGLRSNIPGDGTAYRWHRDAYAGIRYAGPPGTFPTFSYIDVIEGRVPSNLLRGRNVIVGVTASGLGPRFLTPMSQQTWMSGAEVQANVASMLLQSKAVTPLPPTLRMLLAAFLAAAGAWVATLPAQRRRGWVAAPVVALGGIALAGLLLLLGAERGTAIAPAMITTAAVFAAWLGIHLHHWRTLAERDPLTGLANRRGFETAFAREFEAARRSGKPLALILIDVDHFKQVNDRLGHPTGDLVLRGIAGAARAHARRARDLAARLGGDEFALLLPETPREKACQCAEHLLAHVHELHAADPRHPPAITVTLGVHSAVPGNPDQSTQGFFAQADAALYRAKEGGRDGYAASARP
ncbi:CHASE2 domain-containing protein [[Pseudomonas] boreopolis]|uniref:CHASE2 domain-containing protein n=1 Tax=Xanthomonas boreopolis TaxID=86183 RepID=UPI0032DCF9DB